MSIENPEPCNQEIWCKGTPIMVLQGGKMAMEGLVKEACRAGLRMDWYYAAGRAVVKTLDEPGISKCALKEALPKILNELPTLSHNQPPSFTGIIWKKLKQLL